MYLCQCSCNVTSDKIIITPIVYRLVALANQMANKIRIKWSDEVGKCGWEIGDKEQGDSWLIHVTVGRLQFPQRSICSSNQSSELRIIHRTCKNRALAAYP